MIRRRTAAILIAVTLLLGLGHAYTAGHPRGEIEWCHDCTAP